jgi:hypothetical protein
VLEPVAASDASRGTDTFDHDHEDTARNQGQRDRQWTKEMLLDHLAQGETCHRCGREGDRQRDREVDRFSLAQKEPASALAQKRAVVQEHGEDRA